jgi:acetyltransferase
MIYAAYNTYNPYVVDPAHDVFRYEPRSLDAIFAPKSVAVIGATEKHGSVGRTILWNLITSNFNGVVFPVNPTRKSVLGIATYPSIKDVPEKVDLAVIVTPAPKVPAVIQECAELGVPGAIIISAGFKEVGPEGVKLEQDILEIAQRSGMRIVGPNCLGVMNARKGLNATFAKGMARPGDVAFISQSGALCTAVLDWSYQANVGFSMFVSVGSMLDVDWGDLIYYLGDDPNTKSIVLYMETIGDARSFLSAAREVARVKPIVVIKPGRTEGAAKAAASHTGSLTGSDDVLDAAFKRCGVLRVDSIEEVFAMADVLDKQPLPKGPRLTIVTNAGGPAVLATDALLTSGGQLTEVSEEAIASLNETLPSAWSHSNPIDVLGDADASRYARSLEIAAQDENSDGMLVILTPQAMTESTETAQLLAQYAKKYDKPILASWMGGQDVALGAQVLNQAGIPVFAYPDAAAKAFSRMWQYAEHLNSLYETPQLSSVSDDAARLKQDACTTLINTVLGEGRTLLTEWESKKLLANYGIPTVLTELAHTREEALEAANTMGYPVVLKLHSETITHKTDVGGVKLNLQTPEHVLEAYDSILKNVTEKAGAEHFQGVSVQQMIKLSEGYELILGASQDPQFGPVILCGTGGQLVEVYHDSVLELPPLNNKLARRMMSKTRIFKALQGVRGRDPVDLKALDELLVRFSQLVVEQPRIKEIDINPLMASPSGLIALDARVVLFEEEELTSLPHVQAIRPYPSQYTTEGSTKRGELLTIRPIKPEDEPLAKHFHMNLSERSVYLRYMQSMPLQERLQHERLSRLCFIDYDREIALIALTPDDALPQGEKMIGVGRLSKEHGSDATGTFRILVSDPYQGQGVGQRLVKEVIEVARAEGLSLLCGQILNENREMQAICERLGFTLKPMAKHADRLLATLIL